MQRRTALKSVALSISSAIVLPNWANAWSVNTLQNQHINLTFSQETLLAEIVETIIPKTDTPGAKDLIINKFVEKMVADCYDKKAQEVFAKGLVSTEKTAQKDYSKSFVECDGKQKLSIINSMLKSSDNDDKSFAKLVKNITIQGYLNSEYVMTNLRIYEFVPGRYHGCVPA
ncbi:MAG: gluconate 2-dehydrogenase subunit 3 family protein [Arcicella sp.]|nr:gluconate 2-dehydrogenase subunit 3 family protein [Arcicella sp.]